MRRFITWNIGIALGFLGHWLFLDFAAQRFGWVLYASLIYLSSLPMVFIAFFLASYFSLVSKTPKAEEFALWISLIASPTLIIAGYFLRAVLR